MIFSSLAPDYPPKLNALYTARDMALFRGEILLDLISGNVNQFGILFPQEDLKEIFLAAIPQARIYQPDSLGQLAARLAISDYYRTEGMPVPPEQVLITPGTSLSYFYCFKLLARPGDEILCPSPSYPLFDTIAELAGVQLTSYRLRESYGWEIDLDYLESRLTTRTRAVVLISPHNPTGMVASQKQLDELGEIAQRHHLVIIADEVFNEFLFGLESLPRPALTRAPLVLTLNGFSKMFALPGMKLGWIAVNGDPERVRKSMWTLELISNTFLPVNEVMQFSVPGIFQLGAEFLPHYKDWVKRCRDIAIDTLANCAALQFVSPAGGFYLTARLLDDHKDEDALVVELLQKSNVLLHPGYFYDIPPCHLVMSFIQEPEALQAGLKRICDQLRAQ